MKPRHVLVLIISRLWIHDCPALCGVHGEMEMLMERLDFSALDAIHQNRVMLLR